MPLCLKRKIYNQCVITSHDIWVRNTETDKANRELTQNSTKGNGKGNVKINTRRQEKINLDQRKKHYIYIYIRVKDIIQVVKQQKWRWPGHVVRMSDNRWTKKLTDWHPYNDKR